VKRDKVNKVFNEQPAFQEAPEFLYEACISEILSPLKQQNTSITYLSQYKAMLEFHRRLHILKMQYGEIYSKVMALDNHLAQQKILKLNPPLLANHNIPETYESMDLKYT
jgi:hypothetical protein